MTAGLCEKDGSTAAAKQAENADGAENRGTGGLGDDITGEGKIALKATRSRCCLAVETV